jgi:hypothetical protein
MLNQTNNTIVISEWLSPDERYVIFLDELYDITKKVKLGNIWENFDNLKFFLRYSFSKSDLSQQIKEEAYTTLNNSLLTESTNNLTEYKEIISKYLNESVWSNFKTWAKETGESTVNGFKDFVSKTYSGSKELINKISNAEWSEVLSLLGKGAYYFAKKLKDAMYHPVGLILDTILVVSGIGKVFQWIPWAIIVALDIYELVTGKYESLPFHLLDMFFDMIGLVFTGAVAKGLKITLKGITKVDDVVKVAATNPAMKKYLAKLPEILSNISPKLKQAASYLTKKFPKASKFITSILDKIDVVINKMKVEFGKLFTKKVATAAGISTGIVGGMGAMEVGSREEQNGSGGEFDFIFDDDFEIEFI